MRLPGIVDSHCHLQDTAFVTDLEAVLERADGAGLARIVVPGWDAASSEAALELASRHPRLLVPAVGIHPNWAAAAAESDVRRVEELAADPAVVAIGEIGLDAHRVHSPPDVQHAMLERMLDLARQRELPVLVHDRDAHDAISEGLGGWAASFPAGQLRGVLHCFSGDAAMALELHAAGFLISFALPVAFSSSRGPRAAATALPDQALLVETDAPYLGPGGAGTRNEPTTVLRVAAELARLRGTTPEAVAAAASVNLGRLLARSAREGS